MYGSKDSTVVTPAESHVTVRLAEESDAQALVRLAILDSAELPCAPTLLAEKDGEAVAALPVGGGRAIADPFRRTTAMIELLELRAAQLRGDRYRDGRSSSYPGRLRVLARLPRALSPR